MPVVPEVNVHCPRAAKDKEDEVHTKAHRDDERADKGVVGH